MVQTVWYNAQLSLIAVVFRHFVPKAHQRASQNFKANLQSYLWKIASLPSDMSSALLCLD